MQVSIFVVYFSEGWSTMGAGRRGARHAFQVDAVEEALRVAQDLQRQGQVALISVQDRFGELRPFEEQVLSPI